MKVSYIVGIVLPAHVVGLWILLFQPGCQSNQATPPNPLVTQVEVPDPKPVEKPMKTTGMPSSDEGVDSAFNAGLDDYASTPVNQPGVKAEPMRPTDNGMLSDFSSTDINPDDVDIPGWDSPSTGPDQFYKVVKGDTLSQIARKHNISLASLLKANDLQRASTIHIGQELLIPAGAPVEIDVTNVSGSQYKVRKGDTLSVIAKRHGVTLSALKNANNLKTDIIYVGQELNLPSSAKAQRVEAKPTAKKGDRYTVRSGDSLGKIANRYGIKVSQLKAVNGLSRDTIYVGQKLYLPESAKKPAATTRNFTRPKPEAKPVYTPPPAPKADPAPTPSVEVAAPVIMTVEDSIPEASTSDETLDALKMLSPEGDFDAPVLPVQEAIPAN